MLSILLCATNVCLKAVLSHWIEKNTKPFSGILFFCLKSLFIFNLSVSKEGRVLYAHLALISLRLASTKLFSSSFLPYFALRISFS